MNIQECDICLNDFNKSVAVNNFKCTHVYCYECHETLKHNNHNSCPTCRADRIKDEINDNNKVNWIKEIGNFQIESVEVQIGGHIIDRPRSVQISTNGDMCNKIYHKVSLPNISVDYVYLDSEERKQFAQIGHEYLIEQLQYDGQDGYQNGKQNKKIKLNFNHPIKELTWAKKIKKL